MLSSFLIVSGFILLLMNVFSPSLLLGFLPPYTHYMDVATNVPYQDPPWGIAGTVLSKCVFPIDGTNGVDISGENFGVGNENGKLFLGDIHFSGDALYVAYEVNRLLIANGYGAAQWIKVDGILVDPSKYTPSSGTTPVLVAGHGTYTFTSTADSYMDAWGVNHGSDVSLIVKHMAAVRALVRFDVSVAIALKAKINSARLSLYITESTVVGRTYLAYRLTQTGWTERGVTWAKYDGVNDWAIPGGDCISTGGASVNVPSSTGWHNFDVTRIAQDAVNIGGTVEILIRDANEAVGYMGECTKYASKEYPDPNLRPKLYVDYDNPASTATAASVIVLVATTTVTREGSTLTSVRTVTEPVTLVRVETAVKTVVTTMMVETTVTAQGSTYITYLPVVTTVTVVAQTTDMHPTPVTEWLSSLIVQNLNMIGIALVGIGLFIRAKTGL